MSFFRNEFARLLAERFRENDVLGERIRRRRRQHCDCDFDDIAGIRDFEDIAGIFDENFRDRFNRRDNFCREVRRCIIRDLVAGIQDENEDEDRNRHRRKHKRRR
ncbi:hypothetical protein A8F94_19050 [Bacillus sp. FJAT-27225]|uniref:hypothetical protein n=1 Tax=Bacillus sp. FJAT-27225 TaxID=1743144 RepID=UPI00080C23C8|nr:hypothetical protein [Bacillus sp. FJAT-27225]OCA83211.1 hypothetical protein A8F94_19050 [Bacillus sp. FJAT-27225]